jgi:hypothetical protein
LIGFIAFLHRCSAIFCYLKQGMEVEMIGFRGVVADPLPLSPSLDGDSHGPVADQLAVNIHHRTSHNHGRSVNETSQKLQALGEEEKHEDAAIVVVMVLLTSKDTAIVVVLVLLNASVAAATATAIAYKACQWRSFSTIHWRSTDKNHTSLSNPHLRTRACYHNPNN